MRDKNL